MAYHDIALKIEAHKSRILKDMLRLDITPTEEEINSRVGRIDAFLSLYGQVHVAPQSSFDVDRFNKDYERIGQDLCILYEVVLEKLASDLRELSMVVESRVRELERKGEAQRQRAEMEYGSTSLGKTLLFKSNNFSTQTRDGAHYYKLGSFEAVSGNRLSFSCGLEGANEESAYLLLDDGKDAIRVKPYKSSRETYLVPGQTEEERKDILLDKDVFVRGAVRLAKYEAGKSYACYAGKSSVMFETEGERQVVPVSEETGSYYFQSSGIVSFYAEGATYVEIISTSPLKKRNFKEDELKLIDGDKFIAMEVEEETAILLTTDGSVYAAKEKPTKIEDTLCFPYSLETNTFMLKERSNASTKNYEAYLVVDTEESDSTNVLHAGIKEIDGTWRI